MRPANTLAISLTLAGILMGVAATAASLYLQVSRPFLELIVSCCLILSVFLLAYAIYVAQSDKEGAGSSNSTPNVKIANAVSSGNAGDGIHVGGAVNTEIVDVVVTENDGHGINVTSLRSP